MQLVDTKSHLTTKPCNFEIKCQGNSERYEQHNFFASNFGGGQKFVYLLGSCFESTLVVTGRTLSCFN